MSDLPAESIALVSALVKGIEAWASDEDGVHPDAWDAYCRALVFIGALDKLAASLAKNEREHPHNKRLSDMSENNGEGSR